MTSSNANSNSLDDPALDNKIMLGKIASLGFKIKHGFSYHGIAINLNCDLSAFNAINPCGYAGMQMLRLSDFVAMQTDSEQKESDKQVRNTNDSANQRCIQLQDSYPKTYR